MYYILGPLVPLFWIFHGDVSSGFQIRVGSVLFTFLRQANIIVHVPRDPPLVL